MRKFRMDLCIGLIDDELKERSLTPLARGKDRFMRNAEGEYSFEEDAKMRRQVFNEELAPQFIDF